MTEVRRSVMLHMLWHALIGLVIGAIAKEFVGGPHSLILTCIVGMVGGWVGGRIGRLLGLREGHIVGFILSVAGAIVILLIYQRVGN
jgi:uncharacterized membrane protein YeaQ/YmgE (transglycosylase-associated protein family)